MDVLQKIKLEYESDEQYLLQIIDSHASKEAVYEQSHYIQGKLNGYLDMLNWALEDKNPADSAFLNLRMAIINLIRRIDALELDYQQKNDPNEDKQQICQKLLGALKMTRQLCDLVSMDYFKDSEWDMERVDAKFDNGSHKKVDVTLDSGYAMIRDIVQHLS